MKTLIEVRVHWVQQVNIKLENQSIQPIKEFDLAFSFLVFQPYPKRDKVYLWVDGDKAKKTVKLELFNKIMSQRSPELFAEIQQVINTYSFYLISDKSNKVLKLNYVGVNAQYKDPVMAHLTGQAPKASTGEQESIVDSLYSYGFSQPNEADMSNMRMSIQKIDQGEKQSLISKILNMGRK